MTATPRRSLREWIFGRKLDPLAPQTRRHIVLVAFLAWIGLGADGLSSSCYGPEEAFLALGEHTHFALYLAIATAITVFVIALAYNQVIELFPSGGGGYKAATQLVGPNAGLVSGSALIVDYVLTIAISIASGMDALFSLLGPELQPYKLDAALALTVALLVLNLRGLKESILVLMPIFLGFFLSHVALIVYGIQRHADAIGTLWPSTVAETHALASDTGWWFVIALFLRAFSVGGGTYTGIEAVSNSVNVLAEPRVRTGKWTMFYMATSLAFTAAGIVMLYLLWNARHVDGQTLNAVVFRAVLEDAFGGGAAADWALYAVLGLEAGLLLVAANTGFIGGPAVLAAMASDRWVPRQFRQLSNRLVTQNGLGLMGGAALLVLVGTGGAVALLVVLYSINVFITFSLTLFGLCRYWWEQRLYQLRWRKRFALSALGLTVTAFILAVLVVEKFLEGGWITLAVTGSLVGFCFVIRRHYRATAQAVSRLYDELGAIPVAPSAHTGEPDPSQPTAAVLVGDYGGLGIHTTLNIFRAFPGHFRNLIFLSVGVIDSGGFKGGDSIDQLRARTEETVQRYVALAHGLGVPAAARVAIGTDAVEEAGKLGAEVLLQFKQTTFFAGKVIFQRERWYQRLLHNETAFAIQKRLQWAGQTMVIIPARIH